MDANISLTVPVVSLMAALGLAALSPTTAHAVVEDCDIDGVSVSMYNGATTRDKTGIIKCYERESGRLVREAEIILGKLQGLTRYYYENGNVKHENYRDETGHTYVSRKFFENGQLERDEKELSDEGDGPAKIVRSYYEGGALRKVSYTLKGKTKTFLEFNSDGSSAGFYCGERSWVDEDKAPCGFNGKPSQVKVYNHRGQLVITGSYDKGVLLWLNQYNDASRVIYREITEDGQRVARSFYDNGVRRSEVVLSAADSREVRTQLGRLQSVLRRTSSVEREWAENEQLIREVKRTKGFIALESEWYMNGQPKRRASFRKSDRVIASEVELFRDDGQPASIERRVGDRLVGKQEFFDESGRREKEVSYNDDGRKISTVTFDAAGNVVSSEEYHPDGSRKL